MATSARGKTVGRLSFSGDGSLRRTLRAAYRVDEPTYAELLRAAKRDQQELPTMADVLRYCLKLGIETYLAGQPDGEPGA